MKDTLPITAIVVAYNDEKYLDCCLQGITFCSQRILIDLGSTDHSVEIASRHNFQVVHHPLVPFGERAIAHGLQFAEYDWILIADPDEVMPAGIENDLRCLIDTTPDLGVIKVPIQYYFRGMPVKTSFWSGRKYEFSVFHKDRIMLSSDVHRARQIKPGYRMEFVPKKNDEYVIRHFWANSYAQLFAKHKRYLQFEGESKYNAGDRFGWGKILISTLKALYISLFKHRGIIGNLDGFLLSLFWGWYIFNSWMALKKYESKS